MCLSIMEGNNCQCGFPWNCLVFFFLPVNGYGHFSIQLCSLKFSGYYSHQRKGPSIKIAFSWTDPTATLHMVAGDVIAIWRWQAEKLIKIEFYKWLSRQQKVLAFVLVLLTGIHALRFFWSGRAHFVLASALAASWVWNADFIWIRDWSCSLDLGALPPPSLSLSYSFGPKAGCDWKWKNTTLEKFFHPFFKNLHGLTRTFIFTMLFFCVFAFLRQCLLMLGQASPRLFTLLILPE